MPKYSFADKLKIMFSPEKGKSILDYVYNEILIPTAKNTAYTMCQAAVAKLFDKDPTSIPTITVNGHTAYSKAGQISSTKSPDKVSYLPQEYHDHKDITWIAFPTPHDANNVISFMERKIESDTKECKVANIFEYLGWSSSIQNTDYDYGWKTTMGIGVLQRDGAYHIQAPRATRL